MKISELQQRLELFKQKHGDVDCVVLDQETGFRNLIEEEDIGFDAGALEIMYNDGKELYTSEPEQ